MKIDDVRRTAFAIPLTSPSFPPGPYRFVNREFLIVTCRTDRDALRAVVPEPLRIEELIVRYEFIRLPDSTGFGDYTGSGQVIPVVFEPGTVREALMAPSFLLKIIPHVDGTPRICERARYHLEDVATVALLFTSFPSNALTGQSLAISHGWCMQ